VKKILFVCMGNICRSPSAEAVFRQLTVAEGRANDFILDSAGTHSYHIGAKPDGRSIRAALKRNIEMSHLRARQVEAADWDRFDYLVVMDETNRGNLRKMFPDKQHHKVKSMMSFAQLSGYGEVPDPYYGDGAGFELVLDLLEQASKGLYEYLTDDSSTLL
jgi:protein-tyrosine phosphatase